MIFANFYFNGEKRFDSYAEMQHYMTIELIKQEYDRLVDFEADEANQLKYVEFAKSLGHPMSDLTIKTVLKKIRNITPLTETYLFSDKN